MVHHVLASHNDGILPILSSDLGIDPVQAQWLCEFGAIYHNQTRISSAQIQVLAGDYLRIHSNPRRFPVSGVDWKKCLIFENSEFIIINKPFAIPTHASVDNLYENVAHQMQLQINAPVLVTHRLDVATTGILLLAKTKAFQKYFNALLQNGGLRKTYSALVHGHVQRLGLIEHYMEPSDFAPKKVSLDRQTGWQKCELEILSCALQNDMSQLEIRLITGRTHQIRAQMSVLGHPVVGDKLYGSILPWQESEKIELRAQSLAFTYVDGLGQNKDFSLSL